MPATMWIGGRLQVVSDEIAEAKITEQIERFDALTPYAHFGENQRARVAALADAEAIDVQLPREGLREGAKTATSAPYDTRAIETKRGVATAILRDAERAFGLRGLIDVWDLHGTEEGRVERAKPTVIHLNPSLLKGDFRKLEETIGHEAHHAAGYVSKRAWPGDQEEEEEAEAAGRWFAKWRNR